MKARWHSGIKAMAMGLSLLMIVGVFGGVVVATVNISATSAIDSEFIVEKEDDPQKEHNGRLSPIVQSVFKHSHHDLNTTSLPKGGVAALLYDADHQKGSPIENLLLCNRSDYDPLNFGSDQFPLPSLSPDAFLEDLLVQREKYIQSTPSDLSQQNIVEEKILVPHDSIYISGNEGANGFILGRDPILKTPIYNPLSGVVSGNGTKNDPYIIENWNILNLKGASRISNPDITSAIYIENTDAYFVINNCNFQDVPLANSGNLLYLLDVNNYGLYLLNVTNGNVKNIISNDQSYGIKIISSSHITLLNNTVDSNSWWGIYLYHSSNITLINNTASSNGRVGIYLDNASNNTLINNTANSEGSGIYLYDKSSNNTLFKNTATSNSYGIVIHLSSNNNLSNNAASSNWGGIILDSSSNNTLYNNTANLNSMYGIRIISSLNNNLTNNTANLTQYGLGISIYYSQNNTLKDNTMVNNNYYNFDVFGNEICHYHQDIDASNTVDGKPIFYWVNKNNGEITNLDAASFVGLVSCENITVKNLDLNNNGFGILLVDTKNNNIINNTLTSNDWGIYVWSSTNTTLANNAVISNVWYGIIIEESSNNIVNNNTITSSYDEGIYIWSSSGNILTNNTILLGCEGIHLDSSSKNTLTKNKINSHYGCGIWLESSIYNTISDNDLSSNSIGIGVWSFSNFTYILSNQIYDNYDGINIGKSCNVEIYYNNIYLNEWGAYNSNKSNEYQVNATHNWWGSPDGPSHDDIAAGDDVSGNVLYEPWLTSPVANLSQPTTPSTPYLRTPSSGDGYVNLSWWVQSNGGSKIEYYIVYRDGAKVTHITSTRYTDTGLTNGRTYHYQISAVNSVGEGSKSNEKSAIPQASPYDIDGDYIPAQLDLNDNDPNNPIDWGNASVSPAEMSKVSVGESDYISIVSMDASVGASIKVVSPDGTSANYGGRGKYGLNEIVGHPADGTWFITTTSSLAKVVFFVGEKQVDFQVGKTSPFIWNQYTCKEVLSKNVIDQDEISKMKFYIPLESPPTEVPQPLHPSLESQKLLAPDAKLWVRSLTPAPSTPMNVLITSPDGVSKVVPITAKYLSWNSVNLYAHFGDVPCDGTWLVQDLSRTFGIVLIRNS